MFKKLRKDIFSRIPEKAPAGRMEALASLIKECNALPDEFYHQSTEDNFIDLSFNAIDTLRLTKTGYKKFERLCETSYCTENLYVCLSCDVSGYNYWSECQNESNYMRISVYYKDDEFNLTTEDVNDLYGILIDIACAYDVIEANNTKAQFLKELG